MNLRKTILVTKLLLALTIAPKALAQDTAMNNLDIEKFRKGFKNALLSSPAKTCERKYKNTISSVVSTSTIDCSFDANHTFLVRIDSQNWKASQSVKPDGRVEINLIDEGELDTSHTARFAQKASQHMVVVLNPDRTKIVQVYLQTIVKVTGDDVNLGTITDPVFKTNEDTYEDRMLATY